MGDEVTVALPWDYGQQSVLPYIVWRRQFEATWRQGEHVALVGPTGSGKTYVAADILDIRTYVIALSIKQHDDTLGRFSRRPRGLPPYKRTTSWPISYNINRALMVLKPSHLGDRAHGTRVYRILDGVAKSTGWTLFLDDTAYIINTLGLRRPVVELLNVGRSAGITVVAALQQPSSVSGNVPSELKKQTKHVLIWKMTGEDEIESCARIIGVSKRDMFALMDSLNYYDGGDNLYSDFVWYRRGYEPTIVRVG